MKEKKLLSWIAGFLAAIAFCTLLCQKVNFLLCPETAVFYPQQTSLEPDGAQYETVLPVACLTPIGVDEYLLFYVQDGRAYQVTAQIVAEKDGLAAVSASLPPDMPVVRYSSKPLQDGVKVRIVEEILP